MASAHILSNLLLLDSVKLGRLVLNAKCPHQDFVDPLENHPADTDFFQTVQHDFSETRKFTKTSRLRSYLSSTFSASYQVHGYSSATLSAPLVTTYELKNSGAWFTAACTQASSQQFLEQAFDNRVNGYLTVGFRAVHDASMLKSAARKRTGGAKGRLPVPAGTASVVAPGVESCRGIQNGQELNYKAMGDQVFAILYRKVKLRFLSRWKAGNMALEVHNRWKSCWDWREFDSKSQNDEDEDDIAEAALTDSGLDISDDEHPSEDEIDPLLEELPDSAGWEDVREEPHQTLPEEKRGSHPSRRPVVRRCHLERNSTTETHTKVVPSKEGTLVRRRVLRRGP
ncbi:uncharacterized protein LAJ45_05920 [Morchella importuna]|uniref:uncharacterized protein n=1 Tax=Morchella importuna TaxID=1174673 RepID=UPI001E8CBCEE|nr:uncharacterized protein LAJ45_05920 [Morchella importuna]KAH8150233.1 hypothetical protein LAJ45_05920 [Morchella importuna]